ncbi:MAG: hypothetical protein M1546_00245 [Chloroflexi bacterium]|nr:hypothetical protein [Chloroflexota bacterium]
MLHSKLLRSICLIGLLLTACSAVPPPVSTPADNATSHNPVQTPTRTDLDLAGDALTMFFDALSKGDYSTAVKYYGGSYTALQSMYPKVDPQDRAALFKSACEGSVYRFYCWKAKDIVEQKQVSLGRYLFTVRFEDEQGHLLTGGDNRTAVPCLPPETCPRSQYVYTVQKAEGDFLVQELPVCAGCWP